MDSDFLALILALLLTTYVFVFGFLKRVNEWYYGIKLGEKKHHLPPGDMGWPLIGNMWSFLKAFKSQNPDTFIYNLVSRYGRTGIYKTHMFWSPGVIVCTPEICKKVLADDEKFTRGYPASVDQITGKESFHKFLNAEYKLLRRITSASINGHETLSMYVGYIEDILMHALEEWASLNRPIELLNEMKRVFFKVIIDILVGSSAGNILNSAEKHYTDLSQGLIALAINFPGFAFHKALKARNTLENILQSVLEEKKARRKSDIDPEEKRAMMDMLMEIEDETGQKFLEDEHIISFLIMLLLAGHESSAYAVMWATIYLHDNPEMLQKAKEEQEEILKRRPSTQRGLTLQEIRQMEYLSNVFHETMRMASLFLCIFREAKVDVNINGYLVPKGWKVLVWNRELHMDPENYPNPQVFSPSRWDNQKPKAGSFIPFGAGTRICPGADLAKLQTFIFLHYFLLNYKLERVNPRGPTKYSVHLVLQITA